MSTCAGTPHAVGPSPKPRWLRSLCRMIARKFPVCRRNSRRCPACVQEGLMLGPAAMLEYSGISLRREGG